jgi:hypothetical protein
MSDETNEYPPVSGRDALAIRRAYNFRAVGIPEFWSSQERAFLDAYSQAVALWQELGGDAPPLPPLWGEEEHYADDPRDEDSDA